MYSSSHVHYNLDPRITWLLNKMCQSRPTHFWSLIFQSEHLYFSLKMLWIVVLWVATHGLLLVGSTCAVGVLLGPTRVLPMPRQCGIGRVRRVASVMSSSGLWSVREGSEYECIWTPLFDWVVQIAGPRSTVVHSTNEPLGLHHNEAGFCRGLRPPLPWSLDAPNPLTWRSPIWVAAHYRSQSCAKPSVHCFDDSLQCFNVARISSTDPQMNHFWVHDILQRTLCVSARLSTDLEIGFPQGVKECSEKVGKSYCGEVLLVARSRCSVRLGTSRPDGPKHMQRIVRDSNVLVIPFAMNFMTAEMREKSCPCVWEYSFLAIFLAMLLTPGFRALDQTCLESIPNCLLAVASTLT